MIMYCVLLSLYNSTQIVGSTKEQLLEDTDRYTSNEITGY